MAHVSDQIRVLQMAPGDVDRNPQAVACCDGPAPCADLAAGCDQHQAAELDDLARFFGNRDEDTRHHAAVLRVIPAHESFDTQQLAVGEIDDRLELEEELVALQGALHVLFEPQPMPQLLLHARVKNDEPPLAGCLCVVHRDICIAQQLFGVVVGL